MKSVVGLYALPWVIPTRCFQWLGSDKPSLGMRKFPVLRFARRNIVDSEVFGLS